MLAESYLAKIRVTNHLHLAFYIQSMGPMVRTIYNMFKKVCHFCLFSYSRFLSEMNFD